MNKYNASFSFYMIHGGTNFEFWNGAEVNGPVKIYFKKIFMLFCIIRISFIIKKKIKFKKLLQVLTSYDYAAPISESGDITQLYMSIRHWIQSLPNWPQKPLNIPSDLTFVFVFF